MKQRPRECCRCGSRSTLPHPDRYLSRDKPWCAKCFREMAIAHYEEEVRYLLECRRAQPVTRHMDPSP